MEVETGVGSGYVLKEVPIELLMDYMRGQENKRI